MNEQIWEGLLERYGQRLSVVSDRGETPARAFFQPVREREDGSVPTPVGERPEGQYLYLGPTDVAAEEGDILLWNERRFRFLRVRDVPVGEALAYRWGLCEEMDGGEAV